VDARDQKGKTAMHYAFVSMNLDTVLAFFNAGLAAKYPGAKE
jgi:hypothetical protein